MRYQKTIRTLALILFSGHFLLSAVMVISYLGESRAQEAAFDELEELAAKVETVCLLSKPDARNVKNTRPSARVNRQHGTKGPHR